MPFDFKFPDVGEGIAEGEIVKWLVKVGDKVKQDQLMVKVETDKAVVDLPAPRPGVILSTNGKEGDTIKVGSILVSIGEEGEKIKEEKKSVLKIFSKKQEIKKETPVQAQPPRGQSVVGQLPEAPEESEVKLQSHTMIGPNQSSKILTTPAVRKLAQDSGIDLNQIKGTGDEGRILLSDLKSKIDTPNNIPQQSITVKKFTTDSGPIEKIPLKGIRKTIADNMVLAKNETVPVTMMGDAHIDKIWAIYLKEKEDAKKKGVKLTFLPFVIRALIPALKENPLLNSSMQEGELILKKYYNIGVAVETEVGLMVPVIKSADHKSVREIALEITNLAEKSRARTIQIQDLQDSTFTVTNYGSYGGKYATPVINRGESAILGIGSVFDHPVVNKNKLSTEKVLPLSLTFDHRIVDGAQAAHFLKVFIEYLEQPSHLLVNLE